MQMHQAALMANNIYIINGSSMIISMNYIWFAILILFKQTFVEDIKIHKLILLEV